MQRYSNLEFRTARGQISPNAGLDFSDIRVFKPGVHHGILLLRLRSPGRLVLTARIKEFFEAEHPDSWKKCFVVATDRKLRVRYP